MHTWRICPERALAPNCARLGFPPWRIPRGAHFGVSKGEEGRERQQITTNFFKKLVLICSRAAALSALGARGGGGERQGERDCVLCLKTNYWCSEHRIPGHSHPFLRALALIRVPHPSPHPGAHTSPHPSPHPNSFPCLYHYFLPHSLSNTPVHHVQLMAHVWLTVPTQSWNPS